VPLIRLYNENNHFWLFREVGENPRVEGGFGSFSQSGRIKNKPGKKVAGSCGPEKADALWVKCVTIGSQLQTLDF
jgi:hypothetical protein